MTMMFNEWPLLDRFEQASRAGFEGVEIQDPYGESKERVAARVRAHGVAPTLMNVAPAAGAVPGREREFRTGLARGLEYAETAGCRQLHCLAGCSAAAGAEATFVANLKWAAAVAPAGMRLLIEPLKHRLDNLGDDVTYSAHGAPGRWIGYAARRTQPGGVYRSDVLRRCRISCRARSRPTVQLAARVLDVIAGCQAARRS